jgi:hypothetical protein
MSSLSPRLTREFANRMTAIALGHVTREYPFAMAQVLTGPDDLAPPRKRHPMFFGSYDWHSCVHGHWLLARLLRLFPDLSQAKAIRRHFDATFTRAKAEGEAAQFARAASATFERPYGWAWLLKLAHELRLADGPWRSEIEPLTRVIAGRFRAFLLKADYPARAGTHANSAFALALALDYARATNARLAASIVTKALAWFADDRDCQAWEPSGDDFLSPALIEAELMRRVLEPAAFTAWFAAFLPRLADGLPEALFTPARVADRGDGKIAHLDGLNLSRAWCWRRLATSLDEPMAELARTASTRHLDASLAHIAGDYAGEHWLASFALLAFTEA